jgi:CubicO group peptidase (beta-lactamase class C family)
MGQDEVSGWCDAGFLAVREAFAANFTERGELGAAVSVMAGGRLVAELAGGTRAGRQPWTAGTLVNVFSVGKGVLAACLARLIGRGQLDPDGRVARYWPEFAAGGKEDIPVSYLLSHQAGLAWIDAEMSLEDALSWDPVVDALAQQVPHWKPGSRHGYHATTYGWLVGEVIRRITGMSVGTYFHDEIAAPLGLDFWIGLPESEEPRVATLVGGLVDPLITEDPEVRAFVDEIMGPDTLLGKALFAPGGALSGPEIWNSRALHAAEVPAANGIGDARSIARMYAACIGTVDGVRILSDEQLRRATTQLTSGPNTVLLDLDIQFGLGFMLRSSLIELGGPRSFGHFGAGGSVGWADPDAELAFGYVMNRMDIGLAGDVRSFELINACYAATR